MHALWNSPVCPLGSVRLGSAAKRSMRARTPRLEGHNVRCCCEQHVYTACPNVCLQAGARAERDGRRTGLVVGDRVCARAFKAGGGAP